MRWTKDQMLEYMAKRAKFYDQPDTPDPGRESKLQSRIMNHCRQNGWKVFHDRSRGKNEPGWPDLFIFLPEGRTVLVELKAGNKKLRKEQKDLRRVLTWLGHTVHVVRAFKTFLRIVENEKDY